MSIMKKATTTFVGVSLVAIMAASSIVPASASSSTLAPSITATMNVATPLATSVDQTNRVEITDIFDRVNAYRATKGLPAMKFNATVAETAQEWNDNMSAMGSLEHDPELGSDPRISGLAIATGEIIAARSDTKSTGLVDQWIASPGHREHLLSDKFTVMGIGLTFTNGLKDPSGYKTYGTIRFNQFGTKSPAGMYNNPADYYDGKAPIDAPAIINVTTVAPTFNGATGKYVIPDVVGVQYTVNGNNVNAGTYDSGWKNIVIQATGKTGYKAFGAMYWDYDFVKEDIAITTVAPTFNSTTGKYVIPNVTGLQYLVNGNNVNAGTYDSGWTRVSVTVVAKAGYKINGTNSWAYTFVKPDTTVTVTTQAPTFTASTGKYTIPNVDGIQYLVNGKNVKAGTFDSGWVKISVTAVAKSGYKLSGTTSWSYTFVKPAPAIKTVGTKAPSFNGSTGTYVIPNVTGIQYLANGKNVNAGTYNSGWVKTTITVVAKSGYKLSGTTSWSNNFVRPASPSIPDSGAIITIDPQGNLWNYGYSPRKLIGSGWGGFKDIHVIDWNSDGVLDIIGKTNAGQVYFYSGNKYGGFGKSMIGNGGWQNYEIDVAKWKKTDRYPSIIAKETKTGKLFHYTNPAGKTMGARTQIGSGWGGLTINILDWDRDGNADVLVRNNKGQMLLYRTNGKGNFLSENRKVIGSGWQGFNAIETTSGVGGKGTVGLMTRTANGDIFYYQANKNYWTPGKKVGNGWKLFRIAGH